MFKRPDRQGWDKVAYQKHLERLNATKSSIENTPPKAYPISNKAEIEKRRKLAMIDRDNQILLNRLEQLGKRESGTLNSQVDNSLEQKRSFRAQMVLVRKQREARRITEENRRLLERITVVTPVYNRVKWEDEARSREERLRHILIYREIYEQRAGQANQIRPKQQGPARPVSSVRASTAQAYSTSSAHCSHRMGRASRGPDDIPNQQQHSVSAR